MKIFGSLTSPFVRKVRVLLHEKHLPYEFVRENPREPDSHAQRLSPLRKVPVLELDGGRVLIDSLVILEYLDGLSGEPLLPPRSDARWEVLHWHSLSTGLLDSVIKRMLELRRPEVQRSSEVIDWEERRIARVLESLARADKPGGFLVGGQFGVADLSVGVALEYLDFRYPHNWRATSPELGSWLATLGARPSFKHTVLETTP